MKEIAIRAASHLDLEILLELVRQYYEFDRIAFQSEVIRGGLKLLLADQTLGQAWLAEEEGRNIGYAVATFGFDVEFGGRLATLTDIYLQEGYSKMGLGRRMLTTVEEYCRRCGVRALELQVERLNTGAQAFYQRQGFSPLDRLPLSKRL